MNDTALFTLEEVAEQFGVQMSVINSWIAAGMLTTVETPDGPRISSQTITTLRAGLSTQIAEESRRANPPN